MRLRAIVGPFTIFALLFGGIWMVVGGGLALGFTLASGPPWDDWILDARGVGAEARAVDVKATSLWVNRQRVYEVRLRFIDGAGHVQRGAATTRDRELLERARRDEPLRVEYDPSRPARVRFEGGRRSAMAGFLNLPYAFAVIGTGIFVSGLLGMLRRHRLLRWGAFAPGRVTSVRTTSSKVNRRTVLEVRYEFSSPGGPVEGRTRVAGDLAEAISAAPSGAAFKTRVLSAPSDGAEVPVVYDPARPRRSVLVPPDAFVAEPPVQSRQ